MQLGDPHTSTLVLQEHPMKTLGIRTHNQQSIAKVEGYSDLRSGTLPDEKRLGAQTATDSHFAAHTDSTVGEDD